MVDVGVDSERKQDDLRGRSGRPRESAIGPRESGQQAPALKILIASSTAPATSSTFAHPVGHRVLPSFPSIGLPRTLHRSTPLKHHIYHGESIAHAFSSWFS